MGRPSIRPIAGSGADSAPGSATAAGGASAGPAGPFGSASPIRIGRYRWFWLAATLIFLVVPVTALASSRPTPVHAGLALAAIGLISVSILPAFRRGGFDSRRGGIVAPLAVLAIAGIGAVLTVETHVGAWISLFYFAGIASSRTRPDRLAIGLLVTIGIITALALTGGGEDPWSGMLQGLSVSLLGFTVFGIGALQRTNAQLLAARDEIGRLAVAEERVRIARDLHDTLGHDLSVIALKSELASRLLSADPIRAGAEIADVQRVARESLASVRETVSGYRRPTLDVELAEVRASLAAAGIEVAVARDPAPLPPPVESVLAWAVREGSTNILRHSGTARASIRIATSGGEALADISDDGPARTPRNGAPGAALGGAGHGLAGLRERVTARGGRIDAGPTASGGYRLSVRIPLEAVGA